MNYPVPAQPKIYHILHIDKLAAVFASGALFNDAVLQQQASAGTTIGIGENKKAQADSLSKQPPGFVCRRMCTLLFLPPLGNALYVLYG